MSKKIVISTIIIILCGLMQRNYLVIRNTYEADMKLANIDGIIFQKSFFHCILVNSFICQYINIFCIVILLCIWYRTIYRRYNDNSMLSNKRSSCSDEASL